MGFYVDQILPHLIRLTMRGRDFVPYRKRVVAMAMGRVLEVGIGSGENLSHYNANVSEIIGVEPVARLAAMAKRAADRSAVPAKIIVAVAEALPLDSGSADTVVMTWTLCSVRDPSAALWEIRRVLKPEGRLLFVEHGLAPDRAVRKWQHRLTPVWKHLAGGCHLDRPMDVLIGDAGFRIEQLKTEYMRGPRPMTFIYEGVAASV
jgi:ubiquinone/menaquinone biosynthesis C-methylase UbiE